MGSNTMGNQIKNRVTERIAHSKGFTLIASLLMLLLLSGIAIGLLMMTNTEGKVGGTDLQNNLAFHAAEGGIEKQASDLSGVFQNAQSPTAAQICGISASSYQPAMVGVSWQQYSVAPSSGCTGTLKANWGQISSGPNQGLWAQIIPVNMLATASLSGGQEVSMTRSAQVALIPVFQFGVFCEGDCGFFDSPNLDFKGRVHTNSDLYLGVSGGSTLTFHDKLEAYGNVITEVLPNGLASTGTGWDDTGNVYIPTTSGGCSTTTTNCVTKASNSNPPASPYGDGSLQGAGGNPQQSTYNTSSWNTFSKTTANYMLINGNYGSTSTPGTGAKKLSMPFVAPGVLPIELIRRAQSSDTALLSQSREYNLAQIHVLLSDDPAELPGGSGDVNNVRLANTSTSNTYGIQTSVPSGLPTLPTGANYTTMFAMGFTYIADPTSCSGTYCTAATSTLPQDWPYAPATPPTGAATMVPTGAPQQPGFTYNPALAAPTLSVCNTSGCPSPYYSTTAGAGNAVAWNLIDGWLRVEYKNASGTWVPVTNEWLQLGFARGLNPPTAAGTNPINPNAILLLQEPADRNGDGAIDSVGKPPVCTKTVSGNCVQWSYALPPEVIPDNGAPTVSGSPWYAVSSSSMYSNSWTGANYYPINFYDAREGEPRDADAGNDSCTTAGVMNAVEIDVGNLKRWLAGSIGSSGSSVDYVAQNGYVLYYSDRRGMLSNPTKGYKTGDSGLEDVVNSSSSAGTPDGVLETVPAGHSLSPEDVNQNGVLDQYGTANLGLGQFGANGVASRSQNTAIVNASPDNPYVPRIASCVTTARKNWVSGARHVLKLVDGSLGNVPVSPVGTTADPGGFTVAAENPVYIQGNYNSSSTDTFFTNATSAGPGADMAGHSAAAVIADAVTILSNSWSDLASMSNDPTQPTPNRTASSTYYRVAIAGGKNIAFPFPSWASATNYGFGTDGGVHNFLRFLEDWNPSSGQQTLNYGGSLVSLYYATYNTGIFKCCTYSVYKPPFRNYIFDADFTTPQGLPPGTPMFRDVEALGYRQLFTSRTY